MSLASEPLKNMSLNNHNIQSNKLPLNLFLTPAQYNKMLITNGKNRQKQISHISEGYLSNLQFVNDSVFEKIKEQQTLMRMSVKKQPKSQKKSIDQCTCCCCQQFCQQCSKKGQNCNKFSTIEAKKAMSEIDQQIALARKRSKFSLTSTEKKKNQNNFMNNSQRANSAISCKTSNKKYLIKGSSLMMNSLTQNTPDISHLVMKSLIQFEQSKKIQAFVKKEKVHMQKAKQQYLDLLNRKVRQNNLRQSKSTHSLNKVKSASKRQISNNYWNKVKEEVISNLKNDTYSATLKQQLKNYNFNVFKNQQLAKRKINLSKEQIKNLREKHENQAKIQIEKEMKAKLQKKQKIKNNLQSLQKQRLTHIQTIPHKPFKPTQQMINSAFKNIIQTTQINQDKLVKTNKSQRQTIKKQSRRKL